MGNIHFRSDRLFFVGTGKINATDPKIKGGLNLCYPVVLFDTYPMCHWIRDLIVKI